MGTRIIFTGLLLVLVVGAGYADDTEGYAPSKFVIKFNQDVAPEVIGGLVVTEIDSIDALNALYGVYDFEQLFPFPPAPIEHPHGLWQWEDYVAAYDEFQLGRIYEFTVPEAYENIKGAVSAFNQDPDVVYAELNYWRKANVKPNDPYYHLQYHHYRVINEKAWDISKGTNVTIAVLDTGVDYNHPDLSAKVVSGWDFVNGDNDPWDDCYFHHGTHVSGIAAATTDNGTGIAGVAWDSDILPVKVADAAGTINYEEKTSEKGIRWAVDKGADVINMSYGGEGFSEVEKEICGWAYKLNVILVAAAGNHGKAPVNYPARHESVISVAATDKGDIRWPHSGRGYKLELCAPGVLVYATVKSPLNYAYKTGTSMAAPIVTGVAALCRDEWPEATAAEIRKILQGFSDDIGPPGWDFWYGYGRVNAYKTLYHPNVALPAIISEAEGVIEERDELGYENSGAIDPSIKEAVGAP